MEIKRECEKMYWRLKGRSGFIPLRMCYFHRFQNWSAEQEEIESLSGAMQSLGSALSRYESSRFAVEQISNQASGDEILVPLTESLYVPGKLVDPSKITVEIGTGNGAREFFLGNSQSSRECYCSIFRILLLWIPTLTHTRVRTCLLYQ